MTVHAEHVVIAVDRDEELRTDLFVDPHRFLAVAVAGGMHIRRMIRDDVRALARKIILQFLHRALVARDDGRREDDGIRRLQAYVLVRLVADAGQRCEFIALRAGRQDDESLRRILRHVLDGDDGVVFVLDESELARDLDISAHGTAVDDDLLAVFLGEVDDPDEALQMRGEHGDHQAAVALLDDLLKRRVDVLLGDREARLPYVGGVHEEGEDRTVLEDAELAELLIGWRPVVMVELDVSGEDDISPRRLDDDTHRIGDGVRDAEEADRMVAEAEDFIFLDFADDDRRTGEFLLTLLDHLPGKLASVDHRIPDAIHDVGDAADVVEVTVRDEEAADPVAILFEITGIRKDVIDARRLVFLELETGIEDVDVVADFDDRHVAADLLDASERDDTYGVLRHVRDLHVRFLALARRSRVLDFDDRIASRTIRPE